MTWFHGVMDRFFARPALSTVWSLLNLYLQETGYLLHWESYRKYRLSNSDKIWLMQAHSKFKFNFFPLILNQPFLSHPCILSWHSLTESSCLPTLRYHPYDISLAPNSSTYPVFLSVSLLPLTFPLSGHFQYNIHRVAKIPTVICSV